jgi:hypothetical protein
MDVLPVALTPNHPATSGYRVVRVQSRCHPRCTDPHPILSRGEQGCLECHRGPHCSTTRVRFPSSATPSSATHHRAHQPQRRGARAAQHGLRYLHGPRRDRRCPPYGPRVAPTARSPSSCTFLLTRSGPISAMRSPKLGINSRAQLGRLLRGPGHASCGYAGRIPPANLALSNQLGLGAVYPKCGLGKDHHQTSRHLGYTQA